MATTNQPQMADERRGLLTPREREILSGDADVSDNYYYAVVSRVRRKIQKVREDADLLREHHTELSEELRAATLDEETPETGEEDDTNE